METPHFAKTPSQHAYIGGIVNCQKCHVYFNQTTAFSQHPCIRKRSILHSRSAFSFYVDSGQLGLFAEFAIVQVLLYLQGQEGLLYMAPDFTFQQ
ncbi:hypothetical protein FGO68_gene5235 [Halteria grandinella]|uniref:Uncharacterized protein n=1 Tax=Halteria grandinella TaxID=5974 RepID=A0A8J8NP63_HALGN|nr:hypothetical protein FGO68_gene5235 [Halteria grandinella]